MTISLDPTMLIGVFATGAVGGVGWLIKNKVSDIFERINELYDDVKKLREDIFTVTIQEEASKVKFYNIFAKIEDVKPLKQTLQDLRVKLAKLESSLYTRRSYDHDLHTQNRRVGDE